MKTAYRILSMDGGGVHALSYLPVLEHFESYVGHGLAENGVFDMFVGTSTGAIVAAALYQGLSAPEIIALYERNGRRIFKKDFFFNWLFHRYRSAQLRATLAVELKADRCWKELQDLGEAKPELVLTLWNLSRGKMDYVSTRSSRVHQAILLRGARLSEIVTACCSGPYYFPPQGFSVPGTDQEQIYCDGGISGFNNPAVLGVSLIANDIDLPIHVFSLGSGHTERPVLRSDVATWTVKDVAVNTIEALMASSANQMQQFFHSFGKRAGITAYLRTNHLRDPESELDDVKAIPHLVRLYDQKALFAHHVVIDRGEIRSWDQNERQAQSKRGLLRSHLESLWCHSFGILPKDRSVKLPLPEFERSTGRLQGHPDECPRVLAEEIRTTWWKRRDILIWAMVSVLLAVGLPTVGITLYKNIQINRQLANGYYLRGVSSAQEGDYGSAAVLAAHACSLDPTDRNRVSAIAWLHGAGRLVASLPHRDEINAVDFSPDGMLLVTGSKDHTAQLWETKSGSPNLSPMPHPTIVIGVAFKGQGLEVLTVDLHGTLRSWDTQSGKLLRETPIAGGLVLKAAFTRDRARVLASGTDTARLISTSSGNVEAEVRVPGRRLTAILSPMGMHVAFATEDGIVSMWGVHEQKALWTAPPPQLDEARSGGTVVLAFHPAGRFLFIGHDDGTAQLRGVIPPGAVQRNLVHGEPIRAAAFNADGRLLVTGGIAGSARIWDTETGLQVGATLTHQGGVTSVDFVPDSRWLVTTSIDRTVRLWSVRTGRPAGIVLPHEGPVRLMTFSKDGAHAVSVSEGSNAQLWDLSTLPRPQELRGHASPIQRIVLSPEGKRMVTGSSDGTTTIWDISNRSALASFSEPDLPLLDTAFEPTEGKVIWGTGNGVVHLWSPCSGKEILDIGSYTRTSRPFKVRTEAMAFARSGRLVASGNANNSVQVWDTVARRRVWESRHDESTAFSSVNAVAFSPDASIVASGGDDGVVVLWNADTGVRLAASRHHAEAVSILSFSSDGGRLLTGGDDHAGLCDGRTGRLIKTLTHFEGIAHQAFHPTKPYALTASNDGIARLWDSETGAPIGKGITHGSPVNTAVFSPDGKWILTSGTDGVARLWEVPGCEPVGSAVSFAEDVTLAVFTPDGNSIVTGSRDGAARLWDTSLDGYTRDSKALVREASVNTRRHITPRGNLEIIPIEDWRVLSEEVRSTK